MSAAGADGDPPDVSIVIANYNGAKWVEPCLSRLAKASGSLDLEVIFVDDASADDSVALVREHYPEAIVLAQKINRGYVRANNVGLERSTGRHVLFLNTDALLEPDALRIMVEYADAHPEACAVSGQILNPDGTDQGCARTFPSPMNGLFGRRSALTRIFPNNPWSKKFMLGQHRADDEPFECDILSTACMLAPTQLAQDIGGMDEDFTHYWVDAYLCRMLAQQGGSVVCVPSAKIVHHEGQGGSNGTFKQRLSTTLAFHQGAYTCYTKVKGKGLLGWRAALAATALGTRAALMTLLQLLRPGSATSSTRST